MAQPPTETAVMLPQSRLAGTCSPQKTRASFRGNETLQWSNLDRTHADTGWEFRRRMMACVMPCLWPIHWPLVRYSFSSRPGRGYSHSVSDAAPCTSIGNQCMSILGYIDEVMIYAPHRWRGRTLRRRTHGIGTRWRRRKPWSTSCCRRARGTWLQHSDSWPCCTPSSLSCVWSDTTISRYNAGFC